MDSTGEYLISLSGKLSSWVTRQMSVSLLYVMCQTAFIYVIHVSVTSWSPTPDFKFILASVGSLWSKTAKVCNLVICYAKTSNNRSQSHI